MKPLITFLTFNRMGNMVRSLKSLLEVEEDFDLYILDNYSQDKTWEYLQSVKDSRIKLKHRFDNNIGGAAAVNYGLVHRNENQDWINFEYDCLVKTKKMVSIFQDYHKAFPHIGSFSGTLKGQVETFDATKISTVNNLSLYESSIWGFCTYIPSETMNQLGYLDEESYLMDQELNARQNFLGKPRAYAIDVPCEMLGLNCDKCKTLQTICGGVDGADLNLGQAIAAQLECVKPYNRVTSTWYEKFKATGVELLQKRLAEKGILCGTRFLPDSMTEDEIKRSLENSDFFAKSYNDFLGR